MTHDYRSRQDQLGQEMRKEGVSAFLAASPVTMEYLHGYGESGGKRFFTMVVRDTGEASLICSAISETQARRSGISDVRVWRDGEDGSLLLRQLAKEWGFEKGLLAVDDEMRSGLFLAIQTALPEARFRPGQPLLAPLMSTKDASEIECMKEAGRIADEAFLKALASFRRGMTERELLKVIGRAIEDLGGTPSFGDVATGPHSAEPHHISDETPIREGDVLVLDFGCSVGGYNSDITRTLSVGTPSQEVREIYEIVFRAHHAGRSAIRPGVPAREVDRAARSVIESAGLGDRFIHRTGHGIGLYIHEDPFIGEYNPSPLAPGNCFSVEPGVYLPGRFGIRIENIVCVTPEGCQSLNAEPSGEMVEV